MADKITYVDKESLVTDPTIAEKNKVTDNNMNEIKSAVNNNADQLDETIVYGDENITNNSRGVINEVETLPYINSEIAIGSTNPSNTPVWFKKGKNLFDKNNVSKLNAYFNVSTPTITSSDYNRTLYIPCKTNTTYSATIPSGTGAFAFGYTTNLPAVNVSVSDIIDGDNRTLTTDANAKYLVLRYFQTNNATITEQQALNGIQIEEGNTATTYKEYIAPSIIADDTDFYSKPVVITTRQQVTYNSTDQMGSAIFTIDYPTGFNAYNTIVLSLGYKYASDNQWKFGSIAGSDVNINPFFVTLNYNNQNNIRIRFDDVEAEVTYSADFKIVLMKVD